MQISKLAKLIALSCFFFLLHLPLSISSISANPLQGNLAPDCGNATPSKSVLWPPNHKLSTINILGVNDPDGDATTTAIHCIKQDEPLNSIGDGNTEYDASGVGTSTASVRQERKGNGNGRVYHISFIATDTNGAHCGGSVKVAVPKNKKKTAVDGGPLYDSVNNNNSHCDTSTINNVPVSFDQSVSLNEDTSTDITLTASDSDQDVMTFVIEDGPSHGTLTGTAPNLTYTPNDNYHGEDSFTFKANDGQVDSNTATVSISIEPVNDIPVVQNQSLETTEDNALPISLAAIDNDGDNLSLSVINQPTSGTLSGETPDLVYTPSTNFSGSDSFTFKANDGQVDSATATISINVLPVNDAPIAQSQSLEVNEDESLSITLTGRDLDDDSLSYVITNQPNFGTLSGTAPNLTYTPNANFHGTDTFSFKVNDGAVDSGQATVNITVNSINDAPTVNAGADQTIVEGVVVTLQAVADDSDGTIVSQEWKEGTQTASNTLELTLDNLSIGVHTFTITVTDNEGATANDSVTVTVEPKPNTAPVAEAQTISTNEDTIKVIVLSGSDNEGDALTYLITDNPVNGVLSGDAPDLQYTPNSNYFGTDSFSFRVNDGTAESAIATISINVEPVNDVPIVNAGEFQTITLGQTVVLKATASDPDGIISSYEWRDGANIIGNGQSKVLTDLPLGQHVYIIKVTDNEGATSLSSVTVSVVKDTALPGSLSGKIIDQNGAYIANTKIKLATGESTLSDNEGNYFFGNVVPAERIIITASRFSFLKNTEVAQILPEKETIQNIVLSRPKKTTVFNATEGSTISTEGMTITLPPGTYETPTGEAYDGDITVSTSYFPITTVQGQNEFPGDNRAINENNEEGELVSYGFTKIELNDDSGNPIELSNGQTIELTLPADEGLDKPATIPMWYYDDKSGIWVESGIATYDSTTNSYTTAVDRVATWNLDKYVNVSSLETCIEDTLGNKLPGYIGLEPIDKTWRKLTKTSRDGNLKLTQIIGDKDFNLHAGADIGKLGHYINNPLYIPGGRNEIKTDTCIIVDNNEVAETISVRGTVLDKDGNPLQNATIKVYEKASGPSLSYPLGLTQLTALQTNENGEYLLELDSENIVSVEVALFGDKRITLKAEGNNQQGDIEITLTKGITNYDVGLSLVPHKPPVANAGVDQLSYHGVEVLLNADRSYDLDGSITSYIWRENGVVIGNKKEFNYIADGTGKHRIVLTITDDQGLKASDEMTLRVVKSDSLILAEAGRDQVVNFGEDIVLDSAGSYLQGTGLSRIKRTWTENGEILCEKNHQLCRITNLAVGIHLITLTLQAPDGETSQDTVKITVVENSPPVAIAGKDQTIFHGRPITLETDSYAVHSSISRSRWHKGGTTYCNTTRSDCYIPNLPLGDHFITLTVTDANGLTASDIVKVTVKETGKGGAYAGIDKVLYTGGSVDLRGYFHVIDSYGGGDSYWTDEDDNLICSSSVCYGYTPSEGVHTLTFTVTDNNGLNISDSMVLTVINRPIYNQFTVDAGPDRSYFVGEFDGNDALINSFPSHNTNNATWSENGVELDSDALKTLPIGTHTLSLESADQDGNSATDDVEITIVERYSYAIIDKTQEILQSEIAVLTATWRPLPQAMHGVWRDVSGNTICQNYGSHSTTCNVASGTLSSGNHVFTFTHSDDFGSPEKVYTTTVSVLPNEPPYVNAGLDKVAFEGEEIRFFPLAVGLGVYDRSYSSENTNNYITHFKWTEGDITHCEIKRCVLNGLSAGSHILTLTVTDNNGLSSSDQIVVEVQEHLLSADAGLDTSIFEGDAVTLQTELSPGPIAAYSWHSGNTVYCENSISCSINNLPVGINEITLTVKRNDGFEVSDNVLVNVVDLDLDNSFVVDAGDDQQVIIGQGVTLDGSNSYNFYASLVTFEWLEKGAVIATGKNSFLSNLSVGTHYITLKITDSNNVTLSDTVVISVSDGTDNLIAIAGEDQTAGAGTSVAFSALSSYDPNGSIVSYEWTEDGTLLSSDAEFSKADFPAGSYTLALKVTDNDGNTASDTLELTIIAVEDTTPPSVSINNFPQLVTTTITEPTEITGSITDANLNNWTLKYRAKGGTGNNVITLSEGTGTVDQQILATLDPTQLLNGLYDVILEATDNSGLASLQSVSLLIDDDVKVGNYSVAFEDISIPVSGIPVTITRSYDSRQKSENLDFGYGWSVDYQSIKVQESRQAGLNWQLNNIGGILGQKCVQPNGDRMVTVTLPDGQVEKFKAKASPECTPLVPTLDVHLVYEATGDTDSKLEQLDYGLLRLVNGNIYNLGDSEPAVDPSNYRLTTREGTVYLLDENFGIKQITDTNGNTLTYSHTGVQHNSGVALNFIRDTQDRITKIQAPDGTTLNYSYDTNGNLTTFTDRGGDETQFTYNQSHGLLDIIDPRGVRLTRNEYNDEGRLIAQIDADGNRYEFTHDIEGRREIIKDRNGNTQLYTYDSFGNVLSETNALGETTLHTYDDEDNELTRTDALGNTATWTYDSFGNQLTETDALGNVTTSTYSTRNELLTLTDAQGNVVLTNTYDTNSNLTSLKDAQGNTISLGYDGRGNLSQQTDGLGYIKRFTYDSKGNKTSETDALGVRTDFTYDDNGNVLTESTTRTDAEGHTQTLTTTYEYDAEGNVIKTTDPLGNITSTEYNALDKVSAEIDANGNRTEYAYDSRGNKTTTTYPDGSTETVTFDAENNKLTETDRLGRTTHYVYDNANRLIETTLPDTTPGDLSDNPRTKTEYDDAGRVSVAIDANGNRTTYGYDAAGRRTSVTDALGNVSTYAYDAVGNQTSFTDANGNTMSYEYDALDRRTKTSYADGTSKSVAYDALGRKISETDQAGVTTQYAYDALGRLTKVTDVQGNETAYGYDEQGNKISQTDAEGRTTRWAYDKLGRIISRTLPLGQVETSSYDAVGNMTSKTDFNGQTATMVYDVNNRLVKSTYADGEIDEMIYDAVGNRTQAKQSKSGGVSLTAYVFDVQNRLTQETQADGSILDYQYDKQGNRTQLKTTKGTDVTTVNYAFDVLNRLATVTDAQGITTYAYDPVGNRSQITHSNSNTDNYVYDTLNRLTNLNHQNSANAVLSSFTYTLGVTGIRTKITEANGRITDYTYDNLYRLKTETITDAANGNYSASYDYDKVGNRTYETKDGVQTQYTYDDNDRLSNQGGTTYTYDDNGSTLTETLDGNSKTYTYNAKNQLIETSNAGVTTNYQYNSDGIRVAQTTGIETTQYVVDTNRAYAQVVQELVDNNKTVSYTYGDDLINQTRDGSTNTYHYDGLGSTRALSDGTGAITDSYSYEAFGEVLSQTGTTINDYLFAGEQFDQNLGQYYLRARYYDQGIGRFTQQDTWMGNNSDPITLHKYLYGNADPVQYTDPTGNFSLGSIGASLNIMGTLSTISRATYTVGRGAGAGVSMVWHMMGRLAVNSLRPIFSAVGRMPLGNATGRKITRFDKFKRFFVSPTQRHPNVSWGPIGRFLKKAFPKTKWEQHHVGIQAKWFRPGSPSQWFPRDKFANDGLRRLGNAGFNLMSIPRGLNSALGRSKLGTAGLALGSYGIVGYAVYKIISGEADDND